MGLNRSTIAGLAAELGAAGIVEHTGPAAVSRQGAGRPSAEVRLAVEGPYVVAVDLGVAHVAVARVGLGGRVLERTEAELPADPEAWKVGAAVAAQIRTVLREAPRGAPLVGIGVGVPGLVRSGDGLVRLAPNLNWHDVAFTSVVLAALGLDIPITVANDADLGALAEHQRGAGVDVDDLIYVTGNVGVGAGIIAGGHPLRGVAGYAGEVGHLRFDPAGAPCHCGNVGCWETVVGGPALAKALGLATTDMTGIVGALDALERPTEELCAIGGDLGRGLAGIVNAFNPQRVILGGYYTALYQLVRDEVDRGLSAASLAAPRTSVRLALPGLGSDSVLLGAAEMAFEPLLTDPVEGLASSIVDVNSALSDALPLG
ncbi:ROK family protein [Nocardioides sp. Kera G14]|uniref:ROK family protein n=1 Tax=Nocardioides sp. Kera G14 TaxID=2884264 RepID=UPI001D113C1D|nr:ROK family protein [Nocardioides sp. Kera G14]UDY24353.1 ROK family protein [Nocardioides sp. Kera G14]